MPADERSAGRDDDRTGDRPGAGDGAGADGTVERAVSTVRYGIDQVADKVKGLLRSDR